MKTTVYLIRHAESDHEIRDAKTRPLTPKGLKDADSLAGFFTDIPVTRIFSSPYLRAVQTIAPLSNEKNLPCQTDDRIREWMGGRPFPHELFENRMREMFEDESFTGSGAESLKALKKRTREFIMHLLSRYPGETIVAGTHALAMTAAAKNYDDSIGLEFLFKLLPVAPYVVKMTFEGFEPVCMRFFDPLTDKIPAQEE